MVSWADLPPDLLGPIVNNGFDFKCYTSVRGTCPAWRRALALVNPILLIVSDEKHAFSFRSTTCDITSKSYKFTRILYYHCDSRCVGSSNGWIAISVSRSILGVIHTVYVLLNPITASEIVLPPLIVKGNWVWKEVSKMVIAPNPSKDNFIAAAIYGVNRITYVIAGSTRWAVMEPIPLHVGDHLIDLICHDPGMVYCLTSRGDVYVTRLVVPREATPIQGSPTSEQELSSAVRLPAPIPVWHFGNYLSRISLSDISHMFRRHHAEIHRMRSSVASKGSQQNAPSTIEPLLSGSSLLFCSASLVEPYATLSRLITAKYLIFCENNWYQVWRYTSCSVTVRLPEGGRHRMMGNDTFLLRYYPGRQPCWDVVKDLGGYSVFVGKNSAMSMRADRVPGLRGNYIYWIGGSGRDQGIVFDMQTGRTTPCKSPSLLTKPAHSEGTISWYFLKN